MLQPLKVTVLVGVLTALVMAIALWVVMRPEGVVVQGEVSADRVDVSARVSGRVVNLQAAVGQSVQAGEVLAVLESPQLIAALHLAKAALDVAQANLLVTNSTRPEAIRARQSDLQSAQADVTLARDTLERQKALLDRAVVTQAEFNQVQRNLEVAERRMEAARANLDLAEAGASPEERAVAVAQVRQAEATVAQHQADVAELTLAAPISGQIANRVVEIGENVAPGAPVISIVDLDHAWLTFHLREDLLRGLRVGDRLSVRVPALNQAVLDAEVYLINVQGHFATWRATRATGDFDLRSFEVRARPLQPTPGLRPGMSVIATLPKP